MTGHPLLDFIMFDQFFNGGKDSGGSSDNGNNNSNWPLIIAFIVVVFLIIGWIGGNHHDWCYHWRPRRLELFLKRFTLFVGNSSSEP